MLHQLIEALSTEMGMCWIVLRICNCELKEERQSEFKQVEITVLTTSLSGEGKEKEREWRDWVK